MLLIHPATKFRGLTVASLQVWLLDLQLQQSIAQEEMEGSDSKICGIS